MNFTSIIGLLPKNKRSAKAIKNTFLSLLIKGIYIIVNLALVPLLIKKLSPETYGVWLTMSSFIGLFSFLDIGLGNGLRNLLAESLAKNDKEAGKGLVSTAYFLTAAISGVFFLFFLVVNYFLNWSSILNTQLNLSHELTVLAVIVVFFLSMRLTANLISSILTAYQLPAYSDIINTLGLVLSYFSIYILSYFYADADLVDYGFVLSAVPIVVTILVSIYLFSGKYIHIRPSIYYFRKKYVRGLTNIGMKFFLIQMTYLLLSQANNIIIAHTTGNTDVTIYNVVFKYTGLTHMVFLILISPLWTATTDAYVLKDFSWIKAIVKKLNYVFIIFILICIVQYFISAFVYRLWIGNSLIIPNLVTLLLLIYSVLNIRASLYSNIINGTGKVKLQFIMFVIQAAIHIPLAYFLSQLYGLSGVLISMCLTMIINNIWMPRQYFLLVNEKAKGIWKK